MKKIKKIELTMQEIWDASKPSVHKNKKKYSRKGRKNKNSSEEQD